MVPWWHKEEFTCLKVQFARHGSSRIHIWQGNRCRIARVSFQLLLTLPWLRGKNVAWWNQVKMNINRVLQREKNKASEKSSICSAVWKKIGRCLLWLSSQDERFSALPLWISDVFGAPAEGHSPPLPASWLSHRSFVQLRKCWSSALIWNPWSFLSMGFTSTRHILEMVLSKSLLSLLWKHLLLCLLSLAASVLMSTLVWICWIAAYYRQ